MRDLDALRQNDGRAIGRPVEGVVPPRTRRRRLGQRQRAILYGVLAALALVALIALGSRGFHWFDAALIGYAVASVFALAAVTYKYTFWLMRPQTGRYFWRSWRLFFSFANFRRYTALIPSAILSDLLTQQFIRKRGVYRWIMHHVHLLGRRALLPHYFPAHLRLAALHPNPGAQYQSGCWASRSSPSRRIRSWPSSSITPWSSPRYRCWWA